MEFRNLKAEEIMVRPTDTKFKGSATLLLYQDARCGMDILDETVGSESWQKEYYEVKGNVYCRVGIKTATGEWIWKADCGIESNIDAQKGEASDAFKRAVVNFGIGRELYSAPKIKIRCPEDYYYNEKLCMTFSVKSIEYWGKTISSLVIIDRRGNEVFKWDIKEGEKAVTQTTKVLDKTNEEKLKDFCSAVKGTEPVDKLLAFYTYYTDRARTWAGYFDPKKLYERWGTGTKS